MPDRVDGARRPDPDVAARQGRWALTSQPSDEQARKLAVLAIEVRIADGVGDRDDLARARSQRAGDAEFAEVARRWSRTRGVHAGLRSGRVTDRLTIARAGRLPCDQASAAA